MTADDTPIPPRLPDIPGGVPRETARDLGNVSRETTSDTPIMREAAQALQVMNTRQERWPRPPTTRVMTVVNQKGGVGKTTSAVNIAAGLALHGLRVCLIDLDPQGNASTALSIDHQVGVPSVYDVLLSARPLGEVIRDAEAIANLSCAPARAGAERLSRVGVGRRPRLRPHRLPPVAGIAHPERVGGRP
jgi:chromosome partitioning protein